MTGCVSPLGAAVRGALAGAAGTVALDAVNYARYRTGGGTDGPLAWEFSAGLDSWDDAPAPAQVGRRLVEGLFERELPPGAARLTNNIVHWTQGVMSGAAFGIVAASTRRPGALRGPLFGTAIWLGSYVVLPLAKLYRPIWEYDTKTLAHDWAGHLAYGTTTAAVFRALGGSPARPGG